MLLNHKVYSLEQPKGSSVDLRSIESSKIYYAQNGSEKTYVEFCFTSELLKIVKQRDYRKDFEDLLTVLSKQGYKGKNFKGVEGIVAIDPGDGRYVENKIDRAILSRENGLVVLGKFIGDDIPLVFHTIDKPSLDTQGAKNRRPRYFNFPQVAKPL
jgi:hypothetical protein